MGGALYLEVALDGRYASAVQTSPRVAMFSIWSPTPQVAYPEIVGAVLAKRRELLELSQAALARAKGVGMSQAPIGKLELGKTICAVDHLFRIAPALGLKPADIIREADEHADAAAAYGFDVVPIFRDSRGELGQDSAFRVLRPMLYPTVVMGTNAWAVLHAQFEVWGEVFKRIDMESDEARRIGEEAPRMTWQTLERVMLEYYEHREYKDALRNLLAEIRRIGRDINEQEANALIEESKNADIEELIRIYERMSHESLSEETSGTLGAAAKILRLRKT